MKPAVQTVQHCTSMAEVRRCVDALDACIALEFQEFARLLQEA